MEFKNYSFKDLLDNIVDNRGKTCPVESSGIPLIATNCIKDNSLYAEYERVRYISDETYKTWFRGHPEPEDIIFVCKGSPGRVAWAQNPVPYCIAQDMVAIRANKSVIDSKFLFALLRSPQAQKSILNMHVGTMIPHFKKGDFSNLYFDIPSDLEYQKWAGETYFSFSEKIELNKQTNQTLEQMAQALFKSWFVDFDPVFDNLLASVDFKLDNLESRLPDELKQKAQRRLAALNSLENATECKASLIALAHELQAQLPTKEATQAAGQVSGEAAEISVKANLNANPKILAQHANTHAHFPNEFEHNEQLGWIPKGWKVNDIDKVSSAIIDHRGKTPKKLGGDWTPSGVPAISAKNIKAGRLVREDTIRFVDICMFQKWMKTPLKQGDIAMTSEAPLGELYYFAEGSNYLLSQRLYGIRANKEKCTGSYLYYWFQSDFARADLDGRATGTTVVGIRQSELRKVLVLIPSKNILSIFSPVAESYLLKMEKNANNNSQLTKLRDTLLPKLISGELQIPDVATDDETVD
ncbi:restriction endonuclease subunit S [Pseudoalteromonas sp. K222D]|uniref:restriction endonuclease subunit S n=1 Tax=Pseudoalteromonas sp. K222D TaxID=2820756 RepID=UPI001AD6CC1C|nr:restriction endonuclease subunit S [Pseudoalteromonas sp. K222D]MBO7926309.1 restriction endonuclease subunit S [Pseudoalteromonas sp. K222D]